MQVCLMMTQKQYDQALIEKTNCISTMSEIDRIDRYRTLLTGLRAVPRGDFHNKLEVSLTILKCDLPQLRNRLNIPVFRMTE